MSEDLGTEPMSQEGDRPEEDNEATGSDQVVGDDESEYGAAGEEGQTGEEGGQRGPREQDEDQGI